MYAFLVGMMAARYWRGLLWTVGWVLVLVLPAAHPQWGIRGSVAVVLFGLFAWWVRRRRRMRFAQQRFAEMQLQADLNAQAMWEQQQWAQQQRFAEMQLQAQLNAQAMFDEHVRRTGVIPYGQDQARDW